MKAKCSSWETTNEAGYVDPRLQRNPALLANTDEAMDNTDPPVYNPSQLQCWNCNVRPTQRNHPSLLQQ